MRTIAKLLLQGEERGVKDLLAAGISNRGKVRANNEDRFVIIGEDALQLFAVADGMGGHAAGEVASSMALDVVRGYLSSHQQILLEIAAEGKSLRPYLEDMLSLTNEMVLLAGGEKVEYNGMGTTLTLLVNVLDRSWLAHIGDSRAYLLRGDDLTLLTEDHTLISQLVKSGQIRKEDINDHPQRHILTRALGTDETALFDLLPLELQQGDRIILCTDGLHGLVDAQHIKEVVSQNNSHINVIEQLVNLANEKGGTDNITVVLAEYV